MLVWVVQFSISRFIKIADRPVSFTSPKRRLIDYYILHQGKNIFKKIVFKPDGVQFVKSQRKRVFIVPSLSIQLSNKNRLMDLKTVKSVSLSVFIVRSYLLLRSPCSVTVLHS